VTPAGFWTACAVLFGGAVVAGLWIHDIGGIRGALRQVGRAARGVLGCLAVVALVALALALAGALLYAGARLVGLGWRAQ
jgi:hypothetical protein